MEFFFKPKSIAIIGAFSETVFAVAPLSLQKYDR